MKFCDFCDCKECEFGYGPKKKIYHARTIDGRWICELCYNYDLCTADGPNRSSNPCTNRDCIHRPRLASEWNLT